MNTFMKNKTPFLRRNQAHKNQQELASTTSYLPPPPPRKIHSQTLLQKAFLILNNDSIITQPSL